MSTIPWHDYPGLADVGYLSFTFGIKPYWGGWSKHKSFYKDHLMVLDAKFNHRYLVDDQYKIKRKLMRKDDPEKQHKYELASEFRDLVRTDSSLISVEIPGMEADDTLLYLFLKGVGVESCIFVDKDGLQVPGLRDVMCAHDGSQGPRTIKVPKYNLPLVGSQDYLLTQVLRGDKSDGIPRLLSSSGPEAKAQYERLVKWDYPDYAKIFDNIAKTWGHDALFHNILLLLMPSPFLSKLYDGILVDPTNRDLPNDLTGLDRFKLLDQISTGEYWEPYNFDDIYFEIMEEEREKNMNLLWDEPLIKASKDPWEATMRTLESEDKKKGTLNILHPERYNYID